MSFSIFSPNKFEIDVLGSRFIGLLYRALSEEDAKNTISKIKEEYPDATHYCYAYCIKGKEAMSDDGEPSHTAGLPLLSLLRKREMDETLLVVVRYFGGTKLGAARLMRTYLESGKRTIENANKGEITLGRRVEFETDYSSFEKLKKRAQKEGIEISDVTFKEKVRFFLEGDDKILSALEKEMPSSSILSETKTEFLRRMNNDSQQ
jgi:uncharacterized YigZ family protein